MRNGNGDRGGKRVFLPGIRFHFEIGAEPQIHQLRERPFERRNWLAAGFELQQFSERHRGNRARGAGQTLQRIVVEHHRPTIETEADIELDPAAAEFRGPPEPRQGIFRGPRRRTAMTDNSWYKEGSVHQGGIGAHCQGEWNRRRV